MATISEHADKNATVAHIAVEDRDTGSNGMINCTVKSDVFSLQKLDGKEFKIVVSSSTCK